MKEYKMETIYLSSLQDDLNSYAKDGWKVISILPKEMQSTFDWEYHYDEVVVVFER